LSDRFVENEMQYTNSYI